MLIYLGLKRSYILLCKQIFEIKRLQCSIIIFKNWSMNFFTNRNLLYNFTFFQNATYFAKSHLFRRMSLNPENHDQIVGHSIMTKVSFTLKT